jgi:hypothetical protein
VLGWDMVWAYNMAVGRDLHTDRHRDLGIPVAVVGSMDPGSHRVWHTDQRTVVVGTDLDIVHSRLACCFCFCCH